LLDVKTYELTIITYYYGISTAPHLATSSLKYLVELYEKEYSIGAQHILHDFFIDDILINRYFRKRQQKYETN